MEDLRRRPIKKMKKSTVQLTSLLDLLFVMIFVSLMQEKITPEMAEKLKEIKKPKGKITKVKIPPTKVKVKEKVEKKTPIVFKNYAVEAIFYFKPTKSNPGIPSGTYKMFGSFDEKTRSLKLSGVEWIDRPSDDFGMVPLSGTIKEGDSLFTGRIDFQGCKTFQLKKIQKIDKNPISGVWEGQYDCQQGATGLTLTIK